MISSTRVLDVISVDSMYSYKIRANGATNWNVVKPSWITLGQKSDQEMAAAFSLGNARFAGYKDLAEERFADSSDQVVVQIAYHFLTGRQLPEDAVKDLDFQFLLLPACNIGKKALFIHQSSKIRDF